MKTAVVYYSLSGNTEVAAQTVARTLGADLIRLEPVTAYPSGGVKKFLWGGRSALMAELPALQPYEFDAASYDTVILCFPVWAGTVAPPLRTFIRDNRAGLQDKRIAAVACSMGGSAEKLLAKLRLELAIPAFASTLSLIDPKDKPAPSKIERLRAFALALK